MQDNKSILMHKDVYLKNNETALTHTQWFMKAECTQILDNLYLNFHCEPEKWSKI